MSELVTIATGLSLQDAYIARATLEGSGISCVLGNEYLTSTNALWSFAVDGVELRVMKDDVPRAMEVLTGKEFDGAPEPDAFPAMEQCCPECGSTQFKRKRVGFLRTLFLAVAAAGRVRLPRDRKICSRCGHEWQ